MYLMRAMEYFGLEHEHGVLARALKPVTARQVCEVLGTGVPGQVWWLNCSPCPGTSGPGSARFGVG